MGFSLPLFQIDPNITAQILSKIQEKFGLSYLRDIPTVRYKLITPEYLNPDLDFESRVYRTSLTSTDWTNILNSTKTPSVEAATAIVHFGWYAKLPSSAHDFVVARLYVNGVVRDETWLSPIADQPHHIYFDLNNVITITQNQSYLYKIKNPDWTANEDIAVYPIAFLIGDAEKLNVS